MKAAVVFATAIAVAALAQYVWPGRPEYHAGWFVALLLALDVLVLLRVRGVLARLSATRAKIAAAVAFAGVAAIGFASVASGLFAPDPALVVGAPGARVRVDDLGGALVFPLAENGATSDDVMLTRPGMRSLPVGARRQLSTFLLVRHPRPVVYVEASDARGAHLTITQPSGSAFLSPVLLMQQRQTIGTMEVPYDSFAVPAAHRIMKAVLFSPQQTSRLRGANGAEVASVLFAANDDADQPIPHALALALDGARVNLAGTVLRPAVLDYPAIDVIAVPPLLAIVVGLACTLGGIIAAFVLTRRAPIV